MTPRHHQGGKTTAKILVVDDEAPIRQVLQRLLEQEGYTVFEAVDGADALRVLATQSVDLATVDLKMPNMDGLTLLQRMQRATPNLKAVVITAVDAIIDFAEREPNVVKIVRKPFDIEVVSKVVREELERRRSL